MDMAILENGYRKRKRKIMRFCCGFKVLNWAKRLKNYWTSSRHSPSAKKQKTLVCIREIQVHKLWTKVYSQSGLTAMIKWKAMTMTISYFVQVLYCPVQISVLLKLLYFGILMKETFSVTDPRHCTWPCCLFQLPLELRPSVALHLQ